MLWTFILTVALISAGFVISRFTDQIQCSQNGRSWIFKNSAFGQLFISAHLFVCFQCMAVLRFSMIKSTIDLPVLENFKKIMFGDLASHIKSGELFESEDSEKSEEEEIKITTT